MEASAEHLLVISTVTILLLAGVPLGFGLLSGLLMGILQAATQVQDQTIGFVPRLLVVFTVTVLLFSKGVEQLDGLFAEVWIEIANIQGM
jgi:Flagellar biosynthesis pathway, component FliQ